MRIGTLPDGTRGFDANARITAEQARAFYNAGYRFAIRYVRRSTPHDYDINVRELVDLITAQLGVMLVQHVAAPGWMPTAALGTEYGTTAAKEARAVGLPRGVTVWCDLEGVGIAATSADVIAYCNAWHAAVLQAGFAPGLYVGDSCGLSSDQLYRALRFDRYWAAYNLNADEYPAVRGVQMRQHAAKPGELVPGFTNQNMDVDVIQADAKGGTPVLLLP